MSIAISDDHVELGRTVADLLTKRNARTEARGLLEADSEPNASFWSEAAGLGCG